jgi:mono/diheme cytochrome c family protein
MVIKRNNWRWIVGLLVLLLPVMVACSEASSPTATPEIAVIEPAFGTQLARGQQLYGTYCASCHGQSGEGMGPFPALNSGQHAYSHADWEIIAQIKNGKNAMPAFATQLSDQDIVDIIARVKAWWGPGQLSEQRQVCLLKPPPTPVAE